MTKETYISNHLRQSEWDNYKRDLEHLLEKASGYINENELGKLRANFNSILNDLKGKSISDLRMSLSLCATKALNKMRLGYLPLMTSLVYDLKDTINIGVLEDLLKEEREFVLNVCQMEKIENQVPWRSLEKVINLKEKKVLQKLRQHAIQSKQGDARSVFLQRLTSHQENLLRFFVSLAADFEVLYVKLCDRIAVLKFMKKLSCSEREREILATETMRLHVPVTERLGIWNLKWQLEDLAFRELQPGEYNRIASFLSVNRTNREKLIARITAYLYQLLSKNGITATIVGRPKHIFSIYKKEQKLGVQLDQLNDLLGVRCLVEDKEACYSVFDILHSGELVAKGIYEEDKPWRDWIAKEKPNKYQSIHTTIMLGKLDPFLSSQLIEVQIRTHKMHDIAEVGVAAHWRYKQKQRRSEKLDKGTVEWTREQEKVKKEMDSGDNNRHIFSEYFGNYTFVITPEGEIFSMPKGSIPIDFAYRIHLDIGNHCVGAKVNGKLVDLLKYELRNGDIIEILTSPKREGPKVEWLSHVKTELARKHIRHELNKLQNKSKA